VSDCKCGCCAQTDLEKERNHYYERCESLATERDANQQALLTERAAHNLTKSCLETSSADKDRAIAAWRETHDRLTAERAAHAETKRDLVRAETDAVLEKEFAAFKATDSHNVREYSAAAISNAALAALLHRCATNLITPPGNVSEEETALRRLAAEVAARPAPAPLRLWTIPGTKYAFFPEQQGAYFRYSATSPAPDWLEIPTVRG
jgi:hypothetical protein